VPLLVLIAIFVILPLAELYVIIRVGDAIGLIPTLAILVADSLLGSWLLKSQGRAVWRRFNDNVRAGRVPHREIVDGVLVIFGGAFLITPGFITDVIGVLLLLPPTRSLFRNSLQRRLESGAIGAGRRGAGRYRGSPDYDVEGTATEHAPPPGAEPPAPELPPPARTRRPRR
jgi:UPF0716 protein FxsA